MNIKEYLIENKEKLDLYTTALTRAHGKEHPEVFEVKEIYNLIQSKLNNNDNNLENDFEKLRNITDNFSIPNGVCDTYVATYLMLEKASSLKNK